MQSARLLMRKLLVEKSEANLRNYAQTDFIEFGYCKSILRDKCMLL